MKNPFHILILLLLVCTAAYSKTDASYKYGFKNPFDAMDSSKRDNMIIRLLAQHEKKPLNAGYIKQLAQVYTANNNSDSALTYWELFIGLNLNNDTAAYMIAHMLYDTDKPDSADMYVQKATTIKPNDLSYLSLAALISYRLHKAENALNLCAQILAQSPSDVNALLLSGIILRDEKKDSEAINRFDRCLQADPANTAALVARAGEYVWLKKYSNALHDYTAARADLSGNADILNNLGICYYQSGAYRQAIGFFKKAISIDRSQPESYYNRGLSYYYLHAMDSAAIDMQSAAAIWDTSHTDTSRADSLDALYYLGICYERVGELQTARTYFTRLQKEQYQRDLSPEIQRIDHALFISRSWYWFIAIFLISIGLIVTIFKIIKPRRS